MGDPYWSDEKFVNTTDNVFRNTVDNVFFDSSVDNASSTRPATRGGTKVSLPTTGLGIGAVTQDYGRKPYLADSYHEMMRRPTYRGTFNQVTMRQSEYKVLMRQSQFEKPYLEDDYDEMQHYLPTWPLPPWDEWDWIPPGGTTGGPPGPPPGPPGPPGGPGPPGPLSGPPGGSSAGPPLSFCAVTCWDDWGRPGDDCKEVVGYCYPAVSMLGTRYQWTVLGPFLDIVQNDQKWLKLRPLSSDYGAIEIHADWDNIETVNDKKRAEFTASYKDQWGNICKDDFFLECFDKCDCYKEPAFSYSDTNATTIAPNTSIRIYVEDGCAPFSWTVSGTGFSFAEAKTDGILNYLIADASACGSASISVTDDCGIIVTGYVRCTTGQWNLLSSDVCELSGTGTITNQSGSYTYFELINGMYKQTQRSDDNGGGDPSCTAENVIAYCNGFCPPDPACLSCTDCIDNRGGTYAIPVGCPPGNGYQCNCVGELDYYQWGCAP